MKKTMEIIAQINSDLTMLENNEGQDDFGTVLTLFSIVNGANNLLKVVCDDKKLSDWKNKDDASFYRFASQLKIALENQREYFTSISGQLLVTEDVVSRKITDCLRQIDLLLDKEQSILNNAADILTKENELREVNARVSSLLEKKKDLLAIEGKISKIDIKKLEKELGGKAKIIAEYEEKYKPILNENEVLQKKIGELAEAVDNIDSDIKGLQDAYGKEIQVMIARIPTWIETIKERVTLRKKKEKVIVNKLEEEVQALIETEKKIQEYLERMKEVETMAVKNLELLRAHFTTNKALGNVFSISSSDLQEEFKVINADIEEKLGYYDIFLTKLAKEKQKIALSNKPLKIGE
jgi:hypothetical protein